jgi:hypothetical protein
MMRCARLVPVSAVLAVALLFAAPASARKFQMSGTWILRTGRSFFPPLQFGMVQMDDMGLYTVKASMGNLSAALGWPNGPLLGGGGASATGSAPATLRIPQHRFVLDAMALVPFAGVTLVQLTTNVGVDAPYAAATLAPGGGPGSFTWCIYDPGCVAGLGGMHSTDPPGAGRVVYLAGANQFGGAMQLGLRRGGSTSVVFGTNPYRVGHVPFDGSGTALRRRAAGGPGSADAPVASKVFLPRIFVTQPTMVPPMGSPILYPGPKVTTMLGTTPGGTGPVYYLPTLATGPMGTLAGQYTTRLGFANTTGTVLVQNTYYSNTFFTIMGSDARTPLGAGNIALAAGGVTFLNTYAGRAPFMSFQKVTLTLAPPIPSLSPAGLAAAAALVLLAAGYALRRRLG